MNIINWLEPWVPVEPAAQPAFEAELRREVRQGHRLHRVTVKAIGRRIECDDVLFLLPGHVPPLAVVHLTYAATETSTEWPHTQFFDNVTEWIDNCMQPDHQNYQQPL